MREDNVRTLPGAPVPGVEPVSEVVEHLKLRLAEAERGEIRSIATTAIKQNGNISTGWHANGEFWKLLGGVDWMKHRMLEGDE